MVRLIYELYVSECSPPFLSAVSAEGVVELSFYCPFNISLVHNLVSPSAVFGFAYHSTRELVKRRFIGEGCDLVSLKVKEPLFLSEN